MTHDDRVDHVIERALSSYSDSEPIAGLEERILSRIPDAGFARRKFAGFRWALAGSLVMGLVFLAIAIRTPGGPERPADVVERRIASAPIPVAHSVEPKVRRKVHVRRALRARALPKQDKFPTPSAMTDEERALVAFVKRDPEQALKEFAELAKRTENDEAQ